MYRTLVEAVLAHGQNLPEKVALALGNSTVSYGEIASRAKSAAAILWDEYAIRRHDFVAISAVKRPDYIVALLATQYIGGTAVLLDKSAGESSVKDIFQLISPKLVISDAKLDDVENQLTLKELYTKSAEVVTSLKYELPAPGDVGEILFTTGTTGKPKGVLLTYDSLEASMENTWYGNRMLESDRILHPLPLHHSYGMRVLRSALWGGASIVLQNVSAFARDVEVDIKRHHCTALIAVPASLELFHRQLGSRFAEVMGVLRYIEVGAGALPVSMRKKLLEELPNTEIHNTWGSTETGGALFLDLRTRPDKIASVGKPLPDIELKVLDEEGQEKQAYSPDSAGRMALRGRMQMAGYCDMPELTAKTIVDGWLLTNDLVYTDEDGYVYMLGRVDDIINVAGDKVSPIEIEQAAQDFVGVRECACIGVDDPDRLTGSAPILYVVLEPGFHEAELNKYLSNRLERYKLPKRYVLVQALPRNRMQKVNRKVLKQMWQETGDKPLTNEVIRCLMDRRSVRDFTDKPVPRAYLETILQTGINAPSSRNMQTWQFTVIRDYAKIANLKEVVAQVTKDKKIYFHGFNAPTAVVILSNDRRNQNGIQDCSCAAENMMLAAHSFGLGSVWINALGAISDEPEIRTMLNEYGIPTTHTVVATLALGWPKVPGKLLAKKQDVIRWVDAK